MKIIINNWNKYQHRTDVKIMHWFRVNADITVDPKMFGLPVESKWLWICLLSLCARVNSDAVELDSPYINHYAGIDDSDKHLKLLAERGLVTVVGHSWASSGPDLDRICASTGQDITEQNKTNRTVVGADVLKSTRPPANFDAKSLDEVLEALGKPKADAWMELYDHDQEFILRELRKAWQYYGLDNPKKKPKSKSGWSRTLSSWLERGWGYAAKNTKGNSQKSTKGDDIRKMLSDIEEGKL